MALQDFLGRIACARGLADKGVGVGIAVARTNTLIMNASSDANVARVVPDAGPVRDWYAVAAIWNQTSKSLHLKMPVGLHQTVYLPLAVFLALPAAGSRDGPRVPANPVDCTVSPGIHQPGSRAARPVRGVSRSATDGRRGLRWRKLSAFPTLAPRGQC